MIHIMSLFTNQPRNKQYKTMNYMNKQTNTLYQLYHFKNILN